MLGIISARLKKPCPFMKLSGRRHICALATGKQEGKLQRLEAAHSFPEIGTSRTRALPVKKLGYDYGIMTIV